MTQVPPTGGYMVVAYVITAVILLLYAASLWQRSRRR